MLGLYLLLYYYKGQGYCTIRVIEVKGIGVTEVKDIEVLVLVAWIVQ